MTKKQIVLLSTGGTIEKTYDALQGVLANRVSVLDVMLARLELRGVALRRVALMNKDSLEMDEADHDLIAEWVHKEARASDGVVVVHGTDRLAKSGERILERGRPPVPVVLTGAMRPYELRTTDALQNLTEALLAVQFLGSGVHLAMHNQVLTFPGVVKDREHGTFMLERSS
ncbi:MAG: asparaginase domain-containing protein [Myxococcota bacterium]